MEKYTRLKYGATKDMTREEYLVYRRNLQKRWRHNHPDWVKANNKHWAQVYHETKPFKCICKICGAEFMASRSERKRCSKCCAEKAYVAEVRKKTIMLKREERKAEYKLVLEMYKDGHTQEIIAETLGRSQSGISAILRKIKG